MRILIIIHKGINYGGTEMKGLFLDKKKLTAGLLATMAAVLLTGCGSTQTSDTAETETLAEVTETIAYTAVMPTATEEADIYVQAIDGLAEDFICGMDASEVLAEERSGVVYYNYDGEEQDIFQTMADAGINYIRLRVWNDPYDEDGNGYGGCDTDLETAIELGQRATQYGMKVCIDFHYSDFWSDPNRQLAPKAWADMDIDEKSTALYEFTIDSLNQLIEAGVDVGMVQVGNEINNGMAGESAVAKKMQLLVSGCQAVRDVAAAQNADIKVVVHYTDIDDYTEIKKAALDLNKYEVDYDIFGISFYTMWGATTEDMEAVADLIQDTYGKQVMVAETSYCYTAEDGDGYGNSYPTVSDDGTVTYEEGYAPSVQGQASLVRDVCAAASDNGLLGVFYWGGTWIPVQEYDAAAADAAEVLASNEEKWETYGTGWASSYAAAYDSYSVDYGGCAWDNQAMFDFSGHPLASLNVFKYLRYGATAPLAVLDYTQVTVVADLGTEPVMPNAVDVYYNDGTSGEAAVVWDADQLAAIGGEAGTYEVTGTFEDGTEIEATVRIQAVSYLQNGSFADRSEGWTVTGVEATEEDDDGQTGFQENTWNSYDNGLEDMAFHFTANSGDMDFTLERTTTELAAGTYTLSVQADGSVSDGSNVELYAYTTDASSQQTAEITLTGWGNWETGTIAAIEVAEGETLTLGVHVKCASGDYGDIDEFVLAAAE